MLRLLRRFFTRRKPVSLADDTVFEDHLSWLHPPSTMVDPEPWDRYWHDQLTHGVAGFVDMFCDSGALVDAMRANDLRTVLCVGSGISQEPRALAAAGFEVTALDLSPYGIHVASNAKPPQDYLSNLIGSRPTASDGHLEFVVGDLCDSAICPGPYDVVIDRRTLQLYPEPDLPMAMAAVVQRLSDPGIFFSHCHDGGWRPPYQPRNATKKWFKANRWPRWNDRKPLTTQVAWSMTTTG